MRKWGYQSSMRQNLQRKGTETNIHFWFGSAIHFAMEDFFGENKFGSPVKAFQAYYAAFPASERPMGADEHYFLGIGMLEYFLEWYMPRNADMQFETVWWDKDKNIVPPGTEDAKPLIEESFMLDLGIKVWADMETGDIVNVTKDMQILTDDKGEYLHNGEITVWHDSPKQYIKEVPLYYHGTLDRIVQDKFGRWWIMDWKTAKSADTNKLDTDDQISAYMWAAEQWFGRPIHGFVYVQLTKELIKPPRRLNNGSLSVDKKQKTTYQQLRNEIIRDYKEVSKAPAKLVDFLNVLASQETPEGDKFIRWDFVTRSQGQKKSTYRHILAEATMMADPNLYLFPNPTRDCIWDCPFRDACLLQDDGKEVEAQRWLSDNFEPRTRKEDGNIEPWRVGIPWPDKDKEGAAIGSLVEEMTLDANSILNVILPEEYKDL
jgi:hypothetical protein